MAKKILERSEIKKEDQWNLAPLFGSADEWEKLFTEVKSSVGEYDKYKGKLGQSVEIFKAALDFDLAISRKLDRLYTYAHLRSDENKTDNQNTGVLQRIIALYTMVSEASSYITPEIQGLPQNTIDSYLVSSELLSYRFYLEKILRYKAHTLGHEAEEALAVIGEASSAPSEIFSQLDNSDLRFGNLTNSAGEELELSHGNFSNFLQSPEREIRIKAFKQYYNAYHSHRHSIAAALSASVKNDYLFSRVRHYPGSRYSSLYRDNISEEVYDNLIASVRNNFEPLVKYFNFRKKVLGLDELHVYDTYVPVVKEVKFKMSYEEAVETCVAALAPLGDDYVNIMRDGLLNGWVDRYENRGKRSGAYSSGCYDSPPYILTNYDEENINSLFTLIHEAGHSMHSYYSAKNQDYLYHNYTIFVAEVASTFNETLLAHYLLNKYKDEPEMQAYILNREIDDIKATLYRQTMFAEFEKFTHSRVEANEPLTLDDMTNFYGKLLNDYFGGVLVIDDELKLECLRIPHFYSAFYVYKYATGISAAIALAKNVLDKKSGAVENYRKFLTLGGSMFPLAELQIAGVDMSKPESVDNALEYFSGLVDRLIELRR